MPMTWDQSDSCNVQFDAHITEPVRIKHLSLIGIAWTRRSSSGVQAGQISEVMIEPPIHAERDG